MVIQQLGNETTRDEHAGFHVFLHRLAGEVRTGDETHSAVGDSDFGMDASVGEGIGLVAPGIVSGHPYGAI